MISGKNRYTRQTSVLPAQPGSNYGISKNTRLFCSVICKYNSFSEAIGFIAAVDDANKDAVDYPFAVTSHEVAHQWWHIKL
jgi:hypothetical protein